MATMPGQTKRMHKTMGIISMIMSIYIAQHYAYVTYKENALGGMEKLIRAIENGFAAQPFNAFKFSQQNYDTGVLLIIMVGLIADALFFAGWLRKKDQHRGSEKGTAKWNDGTRFKREYSYGISARSWQEAGERLKHSKLKKLVEKMSVDVADTQKITKLLKHFGLALPLKILYKTFEVFLKPILYHFLYIRNRLQKNGGEEPAEDDAEPGNMIFSHHVRFNMNKLSNLNNNVIVIGGPGTGKTRGIIKPNMLQFNTSFVVTDPKGELMHDIAGTLMKHGYHIKCFNLNEMQYSDGYNPFRYIRSDEQVMVLIDCLIKNTDDSKASKGDQFFAQAEKALLLAIFYYLFYFGKEDEKNMRQIMRLLAEAEVNEQDHNFKSALDRRFDEVKNGTGRMRELGLPANPNHVCVRMYNIFKQGTGKTAKSILISAQVRLAPFNIKAVEDLTICDTIHLEEVGDSKQALFIVTPSGETTFNFLASMMYTQLFSTLYKQCNIDNINTHQLVKGNVCAMRSEMFHSKATEESTLQAAKKQQEEWISAEITTVQKGNEDAQYTVWQLIGKNKKILKEFQSEKESALFLDALNNGKWVYGKRWTTVPVHFLLDEFKNSGTLPDFDQYLSTMRSYHLSCTIILQSIDQIKAMYEDDWGTLMGDCSTQIFLGSSNQDDLEYFSKALGDSTQTVRNTSESKGSKSGSNMSYNQDSYTLMKPEQLRVMPTSDCIVIISGQDPFYDKKFRLENHRHASELNNNVFDHHLYFRLEEHTETEKPKEEPIPEVTRRAETTHAIPNTPYAKDLLQKGRFPLGEAPIAQTTPQKEVLAKAAAGRGNQSLANDIRLKGITGVNLQPLQQTPITKLKAAASPQGIVEVIMYGENAYPT